MNKSALLHMIQHVSALSDQDVEELEKLAKNFPYCQTAHLLIAKASYDKGNMLSNQKLRKAAVYATNRQLLKKLIYTTEAIVPVSVIQQPDKKEIPAPEPKLISAEELTGVAIAEQADVQEAISETPSAATIPEIVEENVSSNFSEVTGSTTLEDVAVIAAESELAEVVIAPDQMAPNKLLPEIASSFSSTEIDELLQVEMWVNPVIAAELSNSPKLLPKNTEASPELEINNTGITGEIIRYELEVPEDTEDILHEQTLAHFDSYLFTPESDVHLYGELKPATTEEFIQEVYTTNQLGYWMGSSRLGELLQVKDDVTHHTPQQFYPDLVLEYSKQNYLTPTDPPKVSPISKQFEIIDQFLKANPKLKSFSAEKMRAEPLDDLAFKSTKNTKNLASENLANIMVQQGKIKKAIKIYEHLIVKIPEKKAYFAAQIEKLRNQI